MTYPHSLAAFLLGATVLLEADNGAAQQANRALLGHLVAVEARSFVVVLHGMEKNGFGLDMDLAKIRSFTYRKQSLVFAGQLKQTRLLPERMLIHEYQLPHRIYRWSHIH